MDPRRAAGPSLIALGTTVASATGHGELGMVTACIGVAMSLTQLMGLWSRGGTTPVSDITAPPFTSEAPSPGDARLLYAFAAGTVLGATIVALASRTRAPVMP